MRISKTDNAGAITWILSTVVLIASVSQIWRSLTWSRNSWQITEWLIDFAGGFVRRGLPGEVIFHSSSALGVPANHIAIAISVIVYAVTLGLLVHKTRGIFPLAVVFSSLLMGAPAFQDFIIRKDVLVILLFTCCLKLAASASRHFSTLLCLGALCATGILIHESFAFVSAAPLMLLLWERKEGDGGQRLPRQVRLVTLGAFILVPFALVSLFKGDQLVADAIDKSWQPLWDSMDPAKDVIGPSGAAIQALSANFSQSVSNSASVLKSFSMGIYVPLAWLVTIAVCFWMLVQFLLSDTPGSKKKLARILVMQLMCISPLFIMGWDFGRWIFLWTSSSVIVLSEGIELSDPISARLALATDRVLETWPFSMRPRFWMLLLLGIPSCCWTVASFATSSPLGFIASFLKTLFTR